MLFVCYPKCSTCMKAKKWLEEKEIEFEQRDIKEEKPTLPATLVIEKSDDISEIRVSITEGKYHQVKRMFEAVGKQVLFLKRLSMGTLQLDETLTPGTYRALTTEELSALKNRTI